MDNVFKSIENKIRITSWKKCVHLICETSSLKVEFPS